MPTLYCRVTASASVTGDTVNPRGATCGGGRRVSGRDHDAQLFSARLCGEMNHVTTVLQNVLIKAGYKCIDMFCLSKGITDGIIKNNLFSKFSI